MFSPAVLQESWGPLRCYLHSRLASLGCCLRSFDRWYLTHWRSFAALSVGSSAGGTSRTSAPPGAVDRADDIVGLWKMIVGFSFNLRHLHVQARLPRLLHWWRSPRAPSTGGTLLTGALGRWCLRQWRSSTALLLGDRLSLAPLADDSSSSKLCSPSVLEAPNYKNAAISLSTPCSPDTFDQSFPETFHYTSGESDGKGAPPLRISH